MVYLINSTDPQQVFIPKNEPVPANYKSQYEKGYDDGYAAGQAECPTCEVEDKSVVVSADTQTVYPDSGYAGMSSVDIDATDYGNGKYCEGYQGGYSEGEADQKARLSSATFVENGNYELENGWSAVTVQTTCPPPNLEDKNFYLESGFTPTTITPSSGYDGLSSVRVEDNGYGQERYDAGVQVGENNIRSAMTSTAFTENNIFTNVNGWSSVTVNVPQTGSPCNLQHKDFEVEVETATVVPDSGYDGMSDVYVDATAYGEGKYRDGYTMGETDGYNSGVAAQKALLTSTAFTRNGIYTRTDGWDEVEVDIPLTAETVTMTASTQTFTPASATAFSSITVDASGITTVSAIGMYRTNDGQTFEMDLRKWNGSGYEDCVKENIYTGGVGFYIFNSNNIPVRIGIMAASLDDDETRLTWFKVPDGVNWIGSLAFASCSNLVEIVLPSSLTDITTDTFNGCNSLSTIYCYATTAPVLPTGTFDVAQSGTLLVPTGSDYSGWASALPSGWTISATL